MQALVDSTPPQRNMKSIDLLFTSDSFEHSACDVSVANLQSQYAFLYITLTCKEKEKREKEIPVIADRELCCTVSFVLERSGWLLCLLPHGSDAVEGVGIRVIRVFVRWRKVRARERQFVAGGDKR